MNVYGITGTNGKTTTTWILSEFLKHLGPCGYVTTVEVFTGSRTFHSGYTTPPNDALKKIFAEMEAAGIKNCAMEVSSHACHQNRTAGTRFAGAGFTNLSEDHLDYHKTMDAYFDAKAMLFRRMSDETPGSTAAVCVDGDYGRRMADLVSCLNLRLVTCGFAADAMVGPGAVDIEKLPLVGRYNAENVFVASALAIAAGVPVSAINSTIPRLTSRWGRLERIQTRSAADVFVDFAHSDDALANVLSTVRSFTHGKVWAVFGAGGDRDPAKRPLMGRAAGTHADELVVTSDNPRSEDPVKIIEAIVSGIPAGTSFIAEPDRAKAIAYALENAQAGDVVVICGKGHETTQEVNGEFLPFDDRKVAAAW